LKTFRKNNFVVSKRDIEFVIVAAR
jgi:hypothetical protein